MAIVIPVLKRQRFEYSFLGGGASQVVTLMPAISVYSYYYAHLLVRVHARDMAAGQSILLSLYQTLPSDDDSREFTEVGALTDVTITSANPSVVPGITSRDTSSLGAYLKLLLTATQTTAPTTFYAELSAELVLREL